MWRKLRRGAAVVMGVVVLALVVVWGYVEIRARRSFAATPPPALKTSTDGAVLEEGAYLVNAVAHCSGCHTNGEHLRQRTFGPDPKDLRGGLAIEAGPFGTFYPANITPDVATGIGRMTDAELARVIRYGVAPSGRLDLFMAFAVGPMADEDLVAIMSYLRSLPPQKGAVHEDDWGFVAKALATRMGPSSAVAPRYVPRGGVSVARGEYLANGPANCFGCHSPLDALQGFAVSGPRFSGADEAEPDEEGYEIIAPNLTSDPETGVLAAYSEEAFVDRFTKVGRAYKGSKMPWENFAHLTVEDLQSLYRYLRTVPPVHHAVGPSRRKAGYKPPRT